MIRVESHPRSAKQPEALLLNSFFLQDLAHAAKCLRKREAPPVLRQFLQMEPPQTRVDCSSTALLKKKRSPRSKRPPGAGPDQVEPHWCTSSRRR